MQHGIQRKVFAVLARAVWVFVLGASVAAQGYTGAIFSTNSDGTFVNANVYDGHDDPYLNGGPRANANCSAAGLPDGDYYFQVTDPAGSLLLSADAVNPNRRVTVTGGKITAASNTHVWGTGRCNDLTVQLFPYSSTPNAGGEYKVWLTPVERYDPLGGGSFGFLPQYSKTDNFKVAEPVDSDGDGIIDADDRCPFKYDPSKLCYSGC